jgi:hypothetical protein
MNIINDGNVFNHGNIRIVVNIIIVHIGSAHVSPGHKSPVINRGPVGIPGRGNLDVGSDGSPAIIATGFAPGNPGRCPIISGHPHPSIHIVVKPVPIVKRSPSPAVI